MNTKKIIFSSLVTGAVGGGLGLVIPYIAPCPYSSQLYNNLNDQYLVVGTVAGLLIGASQEAVRELKQERDEEATALQNGAGYVCELDKMKHEIPFSHLDKNKF